ncbi:S-layer homology domain-containing protein [Paenibacillus monticola]|uniref:S-layer homology domain-containing protein n=1 Tax=Paenibacillus monticola TaxID=2666075 RepID=UPI0012ACD02D|nr:S-layer homology domain-containing protein [Paenibacillus monticola]
MNNATLSLTVGQSDTLSATVESTATPVPAGNDSNNVTPTKQFTDIPAGYWAVTAINELISKGILNGMSSTSFEPGRSVTRAEFTAMLVRALQLTKTSDVAFTDVKAGIAQGKSTTIFGATA